MARSSVTRLATVPSLSWDDCRLLVDSVADYAIFMLDTGGHVATWNLGAQRIKGYLPEEIIGHHFSEFYPPEDLANGKPEVALETAREVGRFEDEGWRLRKDGSRFWASVVITALKDESGQLRGYAKVTRDLTNRRRAEEELRRSEERFRLLVENLGDHAVYVLDPEGHVTTWNRGAERLTGYTAAEVIGTSFARFFPAEDIAAGKPERELRVALETGRHEDEGYRIRKDGTRFWANAILTPLRDAHGSTLGFAKITRDLTTRRAAEQMQRDLAREQAAREVAERAERDLRASEERLLELSQRLETVLEGVEDGITLQDTTGAVLFANGAAARLCGFDSIEALVRATPAELTSRFEITDERGEPVDARQLPTRLASQGEAARRSTVVRLRQYRTRSEWWVRVKSTVVPGSPGMTVTIWHDITSERRREQQAKHLADATAAIGRSLDPDAMMEALAESLVPALGDWCTIYVLDEGRVRPVATHDTDPTRRKRIEDFHTRFPATKEHPAGVWSVVRTGEARLVATIDDPLIERITGSERERAEAMRATGMRSAMLVPLRARAGVRGVISVVGTDERGPYGQDDLSTLDEIGRRAGVALDNAQLYHAAQAAARAAEEASRAKDEFLATVSHELRTPLNAIMGWSAILAESVTDPAIAKPVATIHRNAQAQGKIIDDILDVARVITGKFRIDPKPTDLVVLAREALEVVRPSATAKDIQLTVTSDADSCAIVADPERLQQVIWNLLSNAVKFTDRGGSVRIAVRQEAASAVLEVTDTGRGIDASFLPHVFEQFKQADATTTRRVGGLGLGLALVKHIVELHGGRVTASSEGLGRGATFSLTLPIRAVIPASVPPASRPDEGTTRAALGTRLDGLHVLVIDDEPDALDLVATVLENAGAHVSTAGSAEAGFEALRRRIPDAVVSDIAMPDEDGFSFARRVRALPRSEGADVPMIALTAFRRAEDMEQARAAGFTTHLGKPVDPEGLAAEIARLAARARAR